MRLAWLKHVFVLLFQPARSVITHTTAREAFQAHLSLHTIGADLQDLQHAFVGPIQSMSELGMHADARQCLLRVSEAHLDIVRFPRGCQIQ